MAATEQVANLTKTTVAVGGYTAGSGVLNVGTTGSPFPSSGTFRVAILDPTEVTIKVTLKVTAINSSTQWAVTAEGTDANANAGDHVLATWWTSGAVLQLFTDRAPGPACMAHNTGTQSITNSGGSATLTFNTNDWDTGSIHSIVTNPTRFTAPTDGYYDIRCYVAENASATGNIYLSYKVNGTGQPQQVTFNSAGFQDCAFSWIVKLSAGDYVEWVVTNFTTATFSTSANAYAQMTRLSTNWGSA